MIARLPGLILPALALLALTAGLIWALAHTFRNRRSTR